MDYWTEALCTEETVEDFDEQTTAFRHTLLQGGDYDEQMDSMRTLRKPPQLTPSEFSHRFDALEDTLPYLPNAPDPDDCGFSEVDRPRLFYNAMPATMIAKTTMAMVVVFRTAINALCILTPITRGANVVQIDSREEPFLLYFCCTW